LVTCVLLGTAGAGYFYVREASELPPAEGTDAPPPAAGRGSDEEQGAPPRRQPSPEPPPRRAGQGVLVLVLQTELLSKDAEQADLARELRAFRRKHGGRMVGGSVYLVNREKAGEPWDVDAEPLRPEAAFAGGDVREAFAACRRAMRRLAGAPTLLVWGCDID